MSYQLQKLPRKQNGQAQFAGAHGSAADAAVDVRDALSLLDSPQIRISTGLACSEAKTSNS